MRPKMPALWRASVNLVVETLVEGEAVVDVGEQVELRAAAQVGVEAAGLDGQGGQSQRPWRGLRTRWAEGW
jgi:hypothetical protein